MTNSSYLVTALAVAAVLVLIYVAAKLLRAGQKSNFVSQRAQEIYRDSKEYFDRAGDGASYSEFKAATPGADPVLYHDVRGLWKGGALTPEAVERTM